MSLCDPALFAAWSTTRTATREAGSSAVTLSTTSSPGFATSWLQLRDTCQSQSRVFTCPGLISGQRGAGGTRLYLVVPGVSDGQLDGVVDDLSAGMETVDKDAGQRSPAGFWEQGQGTRTPPSRNHLTSGLDLHTQTQIWPFYLCEASAVVLLGWMEPLTT